MTLEEIIEMSPEEIDKLTDSQLEELLEAVIKLEGKLEQTVLKLEG